MAEEAETINTRVLRAAETIVIEGSPDLKRLVESGSIQDLTLKSMLLDSSRNTYCLVGCGRSDLFPRPFERLKEQGYFPNGSTFRGIYKDGVETAEHIDTIYPGFTISLKIINPAA